MSGEEFCETIAPIVKEFIASRTVGEGVHLCESEFISAPEIFKRHGIGAGVVHSLCRHLAAVLRANFKIETIIKELD